MSRYVVYHNTDNDDFRRIPFARGSGNPFATAHDNWIYTAKQSTLRKAVAERGWCLFIVGIGKPKRFFLWGCFQFLSRSDTETGAGEGWMLNPPQLLDGPEFLAFKENDCGQFGFGLQNVSESEYSAKLICLASEYRKPKVSRETLWFCKELRVLAQGDPDLNEDAKALERYVKRAFARYVKKRSAKRIRNPVTAKRTAPKTTRAVRQSSRRRS